jgi:hypothetical protein
LTRIENWIIFSEEEGFQQKENEMSNHVSMSDELQRYYIALITSGIVFVKAEGVELNPKIRPLVDQFHKVLAAGDEARELELSSMFEAAMQASDQQEGPMPLWP